jgi:periplasmic protein TonB
MTTLLESGARPYGSSTGVAVSMLLHGVLIAAAVLGTTQLLTPARELIEERSVLYVAPPREVQVVPEPLPEVTPRPKAAAAPVPRRAEPARPRPAQPARQPQAAATPPLVAPTSVPLALPPIDLSAAPTISDIVALPSAESSSGFGTGSSSSTGVVGSTGGGARGLGSGGAGSAYSEYQVERIVEVVRAAAPRFPDALRSSGVEGEVQVTFVVGPNGRVEPGSINVTHSPHRLFAESVRTALLDARFRPAEVGGRPVRQLVAQSFSFRLSK